MKKNILSNYRHATLLFDSPMIEYTMVESIKRRKYLLLLKIIEEKKEKLDLMSKLNADLNEYATSLIISHIYELLPKDREKAVQIMNEESERLFKVAKSYDKGSVERYSLAEMKSILEKYLDEESMYEALSIIYHEDLMDEHFDSSTIRAMR